MVWRLHREPNGVWYARNRDGGRNRKRSLQCKNKRVAEQRLAALIEQEARGDRIEPREVPTVGDVVPAFLEHKRARNATKWFKTVEYAIHDKPFQWLMRKRLDQISAGDVQSWQNRLRNKGLTPATVNRYVGILSNLYTFAIDQELIQPHHRPRIKRLREEREARRHFSVEEVNRLFETSASLGFEIDLFTHLGILAGLRKEEILSLRTRDIDRDHSLIVIGSHDDDPFRPKSRQERRIPVHDDLWPLLNEKADGRYYPSRVAHRAYRPNFRGEWKTLMEAAAIDPPATPHAMRHTFGTMLARNGCTAFEIQQLMGHSSVRVSEVYIHMVGGRTLRHAVDSLAFGRELVADGLPEA